MKWKVIFNFAALFALGVVIYVARDDISLALANLKNVNIAIVLLMIPIQLFSYHAVAKFYLEYFRALGHNASYKGLYRICLELNFVNQAFPSGGISGVSYLSYRLKHHGISYAKSTLAQIARFGLIFVSYQFLLIFGWLVLFFRGKASDLTLFITFAIGFGLISITLLGIFIISDKKRINNFTTWLARVVNRILHIFRPRHPETIRITKVKEVFSELHEDYVKLRNNKEKLYTPIYYAFLANVAEVATIYVVYVAFGQWVNVGAVIIAYALANLAGAIAILPGGIGVYESMMAIVMVSAGVPAGISVSVTIMYRILNMVFFLPVGYVLYANALRKNT